MREMTWDYLNRLLDACKRFDISPPSVGRKAGLSW